MAHIQTQYAKLWKPQDLAVDKINSQMIFIDNIDAMEAFALSVLKNINVTPVSTLSELRSIDTSDTTLYSNGRTIMVKSNGLFFFDRSRSDSDNGSTIIAPTNGGGRWVSDHIFLGSLAFKNSLTASDVGLGNVPNVSTNNQVPTYTQSSSLTNLVSGEKLSVSLGKIMKAIADLISHLANKSNPHDVTKAQVGLGNVDNTSDMDKPISTAVQEALDLVSGGGAEQLVEFNAHKNNTSNPHSVTKAQIGLSNVPNVATNDQTPTYTQASTLANLTSGEKLSVSLGKIMKLVVDFISHRDSTNNPHSVTKTQVGLGNVDNTSDASKPVSTAQATAIADAKSAGTSAQTNLNTHTNNTSNPHSVTKAQVGLGSVPNVATNDQTPTYSQASSLANLVSGEKLSVSFGKIMKAITDLISHIANKSNPHGVTKSQVGLGNVDNTSDLNKPISTAVQTALNSCAKIESDGEIGSQRFSRLTGFQTLNGVNLNTITWSGQYGVMSNCTNRPTTTNLYDMLEVIMYSSHWLIQRYYVMNGAGVISGIYYRSYINGSTWTAWSLYNMGTANTLAVAEVVDE